MAQRASRACSVANCSGVAVGSDYCEVHERMKRPLDERRGSSASRGYGYRWQRQRRMVLARSPLCADPFGIHSAAGEVAVATDVHHIVPLASGAPGAIVHRDSNLMSLCHSCHSRVTAVNYDVRDTAGAGDGEGGEGGTNLYDLQKPDRRLSDLNSAAGFEWGGD